MKGARGTVLVEKEVTKEEVECAFPNDGEWQVGTKSWTELEQQTNTKNMSPSGYPSCVSASGRGMVVRGDEYLGVSRRDAGGGWMRGRTPAN